MSANDSLSLPADKVPPRHIAIIMDGNNRWAKARKLPGIAGHKAGVDAVREVIRGCIELGVEALTLFAFSSENWRRPPLEVKALMELFKLALDHEAKKLHKNNIRLRVLGDLSAFSDGLQRRIAAAEALTAGNTGLQLNIAANYGGRWDIVQAARKLAQRCADGGLQVEQIDESLFAGQLSTDGLPEPDLCIRTGGEQRVSNFLIWQFAYAEFYFTDTYWPDFDRQALRASVLDYCSRQRRFGRTSEQVEAGDDA
ncbi:isoprenyl transferase [Marinobacterium arenosum]|uniref:isoprenyl transferase n=1 Tax=Marinobacterium arenosum TaxID=2862496 RepID=UPI001C98E157|nr:isoprenyl transferase [Marinobacterium arenosum]MBY4675647.1 isoprenyl transferase [Marinobacterium arenosum]